MHIFEVLGANATAPSSQGAASSYLVRAGETADAGWIMVDAGPGAMQSFCQSHRLDELRGIVVTHLHADHCLDLMALAYRWAFPEHLPAIPLYVPTGGLERLRAFDAVFGIPTLSGMDKPIERVWHCQELAADGVEHAIGGARVAAFPAAHAITSNALRFTVGSAVIAFSSDTKRCEGVEAAAERADLFVCECTYLEGHEQEIEAHGHLNADQAGRLGRDAAVDTLLLTHFGTPGMAAAAQARAEVFSPGRVEVAAPGYVW